ncbi:STAS domain-containing protein [Streptomyces sp. NPDC050516]|uniref:STAS domain-containing protein n=1 Tax=Streptomyces sp. NPDC050516 TaxID=3365621 RepID=UPI00379B6533
MPLPQLNIYRHDRRQRSLITLAGEIDLDTAPQVREALEQCLRDGIRTIDVDLTPITFCDVSGLNALLRAAWRTTSLGGSLRLHHPPPMLAWMVRITSTEFLFLEDPFGQQSPPPGNGPLTATPVSPPTACRGVLRRLASLAPAATDGVL